MKKMKEQKLTREEKRVVTAYKAAKSMIISFIVFACIFSLIPQFLRSMDEVKQVLILLSVVSVYTLLLMGLCVWKNTNKTQSKTLILLNMVDSVVVLINGVIWFMISMEYLIGVMNIFLLVMAVLTMAVLLRDLMKLEMKVRELGLKE